jgi:hypothetical protein
VKLWINGREARDLVEKIRLASEERSRNGNVGLLSPEHSALLLRECTNEQEYYEKYLFLLSIRYGVDPSRHRMSRRPGILGSLAGRVRDTVWRLIRDRVIRIVHDQNVFNELLTTALQLENQALEKDVENLNRRISEIEDVRRREEER